MNLLLTKDQVNLLREHTRKTYPIEACGILFGDLGDNTAIVRKIAPARNALQSTTLFQIDPEEFVKALSEAEKKGMHLIGFFHSHPAAPNPSTYDIQYMRLWPENIWLIISSLDYEMAAYQTIGDDLRRIGTKVEEKPAE